MPGGAPGIETRLPLLYHFGVNQGRLSLNQFVAAISTAAARRYGLYPLKGTVTPGADADLVLFDPAREVTITASELHQNCDYTPYEGMRVKGWPRTVLSRGKMVVEDYVLYRADRRRALSGATVTGRTGSCVDGHHSWCSKNQVRAYLHVSVNVA